MSEVDGVKAINKVTFGQRLKAYKRSKLSFLLAVLVLFSAIITIGVLGYLIFYILIKERPKSQSRPVLIDLHIRKCVHDSGNH